MAHLVHLLVCRMRNCLPSICACRVLVDDMADPALCQQAFFNGTLLFG